MFYKLLDKFFDKIKLTISYITFGLIFTALVLLLYWLIYNAKVPFPAVLSNLLWAIISIFDPIFKSANMAREAMPLFAAMFIAVLIAVMNFAMTVVEDLHKKSRETRDYCRTQLERQINRQLKRSFVSELNKNSYMLVKIKINAEKKDSLLANENKEANLVNPEKMTLELNQKVLEAVNPAYFQSKGVTGDSVYFLITDFNKTKNFFIDLVAKSSRVMKENTTRFVQLSFGCSVDVYEKISQFERVNNYLDKVLDLKIPNLITVTSAVKIYYENLHPELYYFKMQGEYTLKDETGKPKTVSLYSIQRR